MPDRDSAILLLNATTAAHEGTDLLKSLGSSPVVTAPFSTCLLVVLPSPLEKLWVFYSSAEINHVSELLASLKN